MKKLALICLCGLAAVSIMTGCSNSQTEGKENLGTVELAEYKGVKVDVPAVLVTDAEVDSKIKQVLNQHPKEVELDRPAAEGDIVNIDYVGKQDGVEFAGGSAQGQDLTLGSGRMIDGFEEGLIGTKKGDKKELNLTFPEDYSEEALAGQAVVFEITVNEVKERQDAVLDNEFVQSVSDYKTVAEYEASIKEDLLTQKQQAADLQIQQFVLKNVVENSKFKLNKDTLSRRYNARIKQYEEQAKMYGTNLSGMAKANGMDVPGLQQSVYASVKDDVKNQLVILKVAELEGITLEDADRQAFAEGNGQTVEAAVEYFGQETLDEMALNQKVMKFMAERAVNENQDSAAPTAAAEETTAAETTEEETTAEETTEEETTEEETTKQETTTAAETAKQTTAAKAETTAAPTAAAEAQTTAAAVAQTEDTTAAETSAPATEAAAGPGVTQGEAETSAAQ